MLDRRYDSISSDWVHKQYSDARPSKSRTTEVFLILLVVVLLALLGGRLPLPWKASATAQTAARSTSPVWVNQKSGFYYCPDSKSYGKLKPGFFLPRARRSRPDTALASRRRANRAVDAMPAATMDNHASTVGGKRTESLSEA